jgi:hypothetical protein
MRKISRGRHADPRCAVSRVPDRRRRRPAQTRAPSWRDGREPDSVAAMPELTARLPLPLGHSLGFGGL